MAILEMGKSYYSSNENSINNVVTKLLTEVTKK